MELTLDRVVNGSWIPQALTVDSAIPVPTRTYHVSAECVAGDWRIRARVYGSLTNRPFDFTDHTATRTVSTRECPGG